MIPLLGDVMYEQGILLCPGCTRLGGECNTWQAWKGLCHQYADISENDLIALLVK